MRGSEPIGMPLGPAARAGSSDPATPDAIVLMSGGIDSAACAYLLQQQGRDVQAIFIDYGQAASGLEENAAARMSAHLRIPLERYSLSKGKRFGSGELVGRNAFLIFAALFLTGARPGLLAMGIHSGTGYYDCSPTFVNAIDRLVAEHTDGTVSFLAPFLSWNKRDVYDFFVAEALPIDLTYSCESGAEPPCGSCASCRDRKALGC
jgi:7-cyano-7-deazaguanine synthase